MSMEGRPRLVEALKRLSVDWRQLKETWQDQQCRTFEAEVMELIEQNSREMLMVMERLGTSLHRARHECGNNEEFKG